MIDTDSPTIANNRAAREEAEREIMDVMTRFKVKTGLAVVGCDVENVRSWSAAQATQDVFVTGVSLTVESI